MSNCLNDARVQAVADGEGTPIEQDHVRSCEACRERVDAARSGVDDFGRMMSAVRVPDSLGPRVTAALRGGATTLRPTSRGRWGPALAGSPPVWVFAGGVVAAAILVFVLLPSVDSVTTLNAAEILDRSLRTLSPQGTELLEYELRIEAPSSVAVESGTYRIEQVIDHDAGRWRLSRFTPDGTLLNGIREDPAAAVRESVVRVDGREYRFRFTINPDQQVRLWQLQRRYAEAMIRLVQASAGQAVTVLDDGGRQRYLVELAEARGGGAPWDLTRARVVVDGVDFHIVEFSAAGAIMGESIAVDFRLRKRDVRPSSQVAPSEFELPRDDPAAIELQGEGTAHPPRDLLAVLLREVAQRR
jgi:hypothetical protein